MAVTQNIHVKKIAGIITKYIVGDEEKPRCRRCTDADAACKYVAHISFRDKNSRTLSHDVVSRMSSGPTTSEYRVLEVCRQSASRLCDPYCQPEMLTHNATVSSSSSTMTLLCREKLQILPLRHLGVTLESLKNSGLVSKQDRNHGLRP